MAGNVKSNVKAKQITIEAVVTRADGRVEKLGTVSYYHRNPLMRAWWKLKKAVGVRT
jgi:hypothetical protein